MLCSHGLPATGADETAIVAIEDFRNHLLQMAGGNDSILDAATEAPQCPVLQVYAAIFCLYARTRAGDREADKWLLRADQTIADGTEREKLLLEACRRWRSNDPEGAIDLLEDITRKHPRDTVAAKACEFNYYLTGQHFQGPRFLRQMKSLIGENPADPDVQAMCSFAYELCGQYEPARRHAERAIELRFATPWAHHALSHIALVTGALDRGLREQQEFLPTWDNPGASIHGHNAWHLAILRLEAGDLEGCMELHDELVWGHLPESLGEQADAISLLWRIELRGETIDQDRWGPLADAAAATADEALSPFVAAHQAYVFARTGREKEIRALRSAVARACDQGTQSRRSVWQEAGGPAVEGSIAAGRGDAVGVTDALLPSIHQIPRIGGSDAQGDLWREALVDALATLGRLSDRQRVLQLFPGTRELN